MKKNLEVIQIQTTSKCDGMCEMCPFPNSWMIDNLGMMSEDLYLKILKDIDYNNPQFDGKLCPYLMNEPFLDENLEKRVEQAYDILYNPLVEISTNASHCYPERVNKLKEIMSGRRAKFVISLHGIDEESHDALMATDWRTSLENALYLLKSINEHPIAIQSMANSKDRQHIIIHPRKIKRFWYKQFKNNNINTDNIHFSTLEFHSRAGGIELDWGQPQIYRQIDERHPFDCKRIHGYLHVLYSGEIVICCMAYNKEEVLGNLKEQTIQEVFNSKQCKEVYAKVRGEKESPPDFICKRCSSPSG